MCNQNPGWDIQGMVCHRSLLEQSPLVDHLRPADLITSINECRVQSHEDWVRCLTQRTASQRNTSHASSLTATDLLGLMSRPAHEASEYFDLGI